MLKRGLPGDWSGATICRTLAFEDRRFGHLTVPFSQVTISAQTRRRALSWLVMTMAAGLAWWLWPKALHVAAQAILAAREIKPGNRAPDFALKNAKGESVSLEAYKGKVCYSTSGRRGAGPAEPRSRGLSIWKISMARKDSPCSAYRWMRTAGKW